MLIASLSDKAPSHLQKIALGCLSRMDPKKFGTEQQQSLLEALLQQLLTPSLPGTVKKLEHTSF